MEKFLEKLQEEINTANNRSKMQWGKSGEIETARLEGKRDGLIMVMRELKKFNSTAKLKQALVSNNEVLRVAVLPAKVNVVLEQIKIFLELKRKYELIDGKENSVMLIDIHIKQIEELLAGKTDC